MIEGLLECAGVPGAKINILPEHADIANAVQKGFLRNRTPTKASDIPDPQRVRYFFARWPDSTTKKLTSDTYRELDVTQEVHAKIREGLGLTEEDVQGRTLVIGIPIC